MLGTAALALQVVNFTVWNRFWPFFAVIFMHLIAARIQFVRMVLLPPHRSEQGSESLPPAGLWQRFARRFAAGAGWQAR